MKQVLKSLSLSLITKTLLIILSTQFGQLPPPSKFLDPIIGFLRVAWQDDFPQNKRFWNRLRRPNPIRICLMMPQRLKRESGSHYKAKFDSNGQAIDRRARNNST